MGKWFWIFAIVVMSFAPAMVYFEDKNRHECLKSYAASNKTIDEIIKICKK